MEIFDEAGISELRKKGNQITSYFEWLIRKNLEGDVEIITPESRGSMLCMRFRGNPKARYEKLIEAGAIVDFREPDIIRATPVPLYNSYEDVYRLVQLMKAHSHA